jgi:hypothetical protein
MPRISDPEAARYGLLVEYAMDMYTGPSGRGALKPPPDPRLTPDWQIVAYLLAKDAVLRTGQRLDMGQEVFYGYVGQSTKAPTQFTVVIRAPALP